MQDEDHKKKLIELRALLERRWETQVLDEWRYSFQYLAGPIPFNCYTEINPDMEGFLFRAVLSLPVATERRSDFVTLCNFINGQLPVGSFVLNPDDGELRWKMGAYFIRSELSEQLMRNVIESSIVFLDRYVLCIVALFNGRPIAEALIRVGEDPGVGRSDICHYKHEPHPRA